MYSRDLDQTARHKALKKHRRAVGNKWSSVIMIPMLVMYGFVWRNYMIDWVYDVGILPNFGIMQHLQGRQLHNWDVSLVDGLVGAGLALIAYIAIMPIVRLIIR